MNELFLIDIVLYLEGQTENNPCLRKSVLFTRCDGLAVSCCTYTNVRKEIRRSDRLAEADSNFQKRCERIARGCWLICCATETIIWTTCV